MPLRVISTLGPEAFEFGKAIPNQWMHHLVDEELPERPVS